MFYIHTQHVNTKYTRSLQGVMIFSTRVHYIEIQTLLGGLVERGG